MEWARNKLAILPAALIAIALVVAPGVAGAQGAIFTDTKGTSDKPQSKLWTQNNDWWCCVNNATKLSIYKLDTATWTKKLDLQNAAVPVLLGGTCDVESDGTNLFVAVWGAATSKLYRLTYNPVTDNYALVAGFPVNITMRPGSETIVIDKDSTGRLWISYAAEQKAYVSYNTTADYKTYSVPLAIGTGMDPDDITTIVSFGNKMGVAWSDQLGERACFRYRNDADAVGTWQPLEIIRSGFATVDDHLNMKADSQGRIFLAVKDFFDSVWVARRNTNGTWTLNTGASGLDCGTRPILQIDETLNKLYLFYTHWEACVSIGNHAIDERVANLDDMVFSLPKPVISASNIEMNNVSGSKRPLPTGSLAILCEGGTTSLKAYWRGWGPISTIGGLDPGGQLAPPPVAPTNPAAAIITESPASRLLLCRFDDATGTLATDASGNNHTLSLGPQATGKNPHWVPGLMNGALFFDGTDYLTTSGAPFKLLGSSFTLESWIKPDLSNSAGTGTIFCRADTLHEEYELDVIGNTIQFQWSVSDTMDVSIKATGSLRDSFWHHVAAVWDNAASEARLYIDGHKVANKIMLAPAWDANYALQCGALVQGTRIKRQFAGTMDLAAISNTAAYSGDFVPPLLYPAAAQKYVRLSWTPTSSFAGVVGYRVSRGVNGGTQTDLSPPVFNNPWFPDFAPTDGILGYSIRAQDALTQRGAPATAQIRWEGSPPAIPTAPQGLDWTSATASLDGPGFWEMDDGLGSFAEDGTELGHDARLGALGLADAAEPHWVAAMEGPGLRFDGNDYCEVADAPELRFASTPFTVEAWIKRGTLTGTQTILSKDAGSSKRNYSVALLAGGAVEFSWTKNGSSSLKKTTSTTLITDNTTWHHIACTYNPTGSVSTIFIDGAAAGTSTNAGPLYTGNESVFFGARTPGSLTNFFTGDMDLVRISNTLKYTGPFTPPQLYRGGPRKPVVRVTWGLPPSGLVLNYHLYRQQLPSGTNTLLGTIPADLPVFPDVNATPTVTYRYTVKAMNSNNQEGAASAPLNVTVPLVTDTENDPPPAAHGPRLRIEPNPFNPQAIVRFRLDANGPVRVELYDVRGRLMDTLVNGAMPAGMHEVRLVRPNSQARLASGIYFVRLRADGQDTRAKAVLIK